MSLSVSSSTEMPHVLEASPSSGEASSVAAASVQSSSSSEQPPQPPPPQQQQPISAPAPVAPQNPFEQPPTQATTSPAGPSVLASIPVVRTDSSTNTVASSATEQQQQPDTLMSAMSSGEGSLVSTATTTTPQQPVSPDRSEITTTTSASLTAAPSSPSGAATVSTTTATSPMMLNTAAPPTTTTNTAPSTPIQQAPQPHDGTSLGSTTRTVAVAPQSAPVLPVSTSLQLAPQAASERRPAPSSPTLDYSINFSPPHQPIFDDDETTEPSSAANTTDNNNIANLAGRNGGNSHNGQDGGNTFSRWVEFTRRRLSSSHNPPDDDEDDDEDDDFVEGAIICGYLQKLGRNGKWQTRWFETDGECLSYYKSNKRTKLLATLDLEKVGAIGVDESDPKECSFNIQVLGRLYNLRADSRAACKDWVITLNRVKEARMEQGNVKLVDHYMQQQNPVVDLLDPAAEPESSSLAPRVVVVANRQRTRAVDESVEFERLMLKSDVENASDMLAPHEKRRSTIGTVVLARWSKRRSSLQRLSAKLAKWARSVRRYSCTHDADAAVVQLDRHVHPPGHDDHNRRVGATSSRTAATSTAATAGGSTSLRPVLETATTTSTNLAPNDSNAAWIEREATQSAVQQASSSSSSQRGVGGAPAVVVSDLHQAQLHRGISNGSEDGARYLS